MTNNAKPARKAAAGPARKATAKAKPRPSPAAAPSPPSPPLSDPAATVAVLDPVRRSELRGKAHHLDPVVMVGDAGLTLAVHAEIERALLAHELIKIRVHGDDREARMQMLSEICARAGCAPVQTIGKLLVVWRPAPDPLFAGKSEKAIARKAKAIKARANRAKASKMRRKSAAGKTQPKAPVKRWFPAGKRRADGAAGAAGAGTEEPAASRAAPRRVTRNAR